MASSLSLCLRTRRRSALSTLYQGQSRCAHDIVKKALTGRPILRYGPGGRSSFTGQVATVFGCTGFLGRYLVHQLAKSGTQVVVPYRGSGEEVRHLKVMGDLGQIVPMEWSLQNEQQIEECIRHSSVVFNLVGRDAETKRFGYFDVHVDGARRIARACSQVGVSRLIHTSHLNADPSSASKYYQCKAHGEEVVKEMFPNATIVRPGPIFGYEDRFLNKMIQRPWQFRVNHLETITRPVSVHNVANAMAILMNVESTIGRTVSLVGPNTYTYETLFQTLESLTFRKNLSKGFINIPKKGLEWASTLWDRLIWWPTLSPDQVKRKFINDKEPESNSLLFQDLGITPDSIEQVALTYLRHYRPSILHDVPVQTIQAKTIKA